MPPADTANAADTVASIIRRRKTEKVLGDVDTPTTISAEAATRNRELVLDAVETAGWAPFHYARGVDGLAEPWRAYVLWHEQAHEVARFLRDDLGATNKEPALAAGCSALILVTWLPEFGDEASREASPLDRDKQQMRDEEHLAAAAAMVQNLLLMLTAQGMGTYWSTGSKLRGPEVFSRLGVGAGERLLAAVFVDYPEAATPDAQRIPGAHREKRSREWIREVDL